ncbi:MAG: hypothetical protein PHE18_05165, partial [Candidatus Omnitrophica bacterium]|nr:hypothetical protein [Candidatus Omnitrophota bacterium]
MQRPEKYFRQLLLEAKRHRNAFLGFFMLAVTAATILWTTRDIEAFQIKRVIRGNTTLDTTTEILTVDLEDPNADGNTADTLLGGEALVVSKSFLIVSNNINRNTRTTTDLVSLIDDATHILLARFASGTGTTSYAEYQVLEFAEGVNVTSGLTIISESAHTKIITLPDPVPLNRTIALVNWKCDRTDVAEDERNFFSIDFVDNTTARIRRGERASRFNNNLGYQIITFDRDINVQNGTLVFAADSNTTSVSPVDTGKSALFLSVKAGNLSDPSVVNGDTTNNDGNLDGYEGKYNVDGWIENSTILNFTRSYNANTVTVPWFLAEFQNEALVKKGRYSWASGDSNETLTVPDSVTLDPGRSLLITQVSGGTSSSNDYLAASLLRSNLTSGTNLELTRSVNTIPLNVTWYAVEFPPLDLTVLNEGTTDNTALRIGDNYTITWNHADAVKDYPAAIRLNTANSTSFHSAYNLAVNITAINVSDGTYTWSIPPEIGTANLIGEDIRIGIAAENATFNTTYGGRSFDICNQRFEIKPNMTLQSPAGGEEWIVNESSKNITWKKWGNLSADNFTIAVSSNGGGAYANITTFSQSDVCADANNCSWTWNTIGDYIGKGLRVKVSWEADPDYVASASSINFTVKGKLNITAPNGGETWNSSEMKSVTWDKWGNWTHSAHGANKVNLSYSYPGGGGSIQNNVSSPSGGNSYDWLVPTITSDLVTVRVESVQDDADLVVNDTSDAVFSITPLVNVTEPDRDNPTTWYYGNTQNISWKLSTAGSVEKVHCWYTKDYVNATECSNWTRITPLNGVPANNTGDPINGSYSWTISDTAAMGDDVRIRVAKYVTDACYSTPFGDANRSIAIRPNIQITRPNATSVFRVTEPEIINFNVQGLSASEYLRIKFSPTGNFDDPDFYENLTEDLSATSTYWDWPSVPDNITSSAKIRIEWQNNTNVYNDSGEFDIKGNLTLNKPAAGNISYVNGTMTINWTSFGSIGNTRINYTADGGSDGYNHSVLNSTDGLNFTSTGEYSWTVPTDAMISDNVNIRVYSVSDPGVNATSGRVNIRGKVYMSAPDTGSEKWPMGTGQYINWSRDGTKMGNVSFWLSANSTPDYTYQIGENSTADGINSFSWSVPDIITAMGLNENQILNKTRIMVKSDNNTTDASSNPFYIPPSFNVTSPVYGEPLKVDDTKVISWTTFGRCSQVELYFSENGGSSWIPIYLDGENYLLNNWSAPNVTYFNWTVANASGQNCRVMVCSHYANESMSDYLEACGASENFTIGGKIDIDWPAGSLSVNVDDTPSISWTPHGALGNFSLSFYNGSGYEPISGADNVDGTSFVWAVPDKIGTGRRVRVTSIDQPTVSETSDPFSIWGAIRLDVPNGGENLPIGTAYNISWFPHGSTLGTLNITYDPDNGTQGYPYLINNTTNANALNYTWNIPSDFDPATNGKIKIQSKTYANVTDTSNSAFEVRGIIGLSDPLPDESLNLTVGDVYNITWSKTGNITSYQFYVSYDGIGPPWEVNNTVVQNYTLWTVTDNIKTTPQLYFKVEDSGNYKVNSTSTTASAIKGSILVMQPNGGENWLKGSSREIKWRTINGSYPGNIKIEYYNNSNSSWDTLDNVTSGIENETKTWTWSPIPEDIGTNTQVRVSTQTGHAAIDVSDTSNNTFNITGNISVVTPNGGETWYVGQEKTIQWNSIGLVTPVKIEFSNDTGGSWTILNNTFHGTEGLNNYTWTVSQDIKSDTCLFRVSDNRTAFVNLVTDESNATFRIRPQINVTEPASEQNVTAGSINTTRINWTYTGTAIGAVNIDYSTNGGQDYTNIESDVDPDNGTFYVWPEVPAAKSTNAKIRIYDTEISKANVTGYSPGTFNIIGYLRLIAPNGNENWPVGTPQVVTWTSTAVNYVNASYSLNGAGGPWNTIENNIPAVNASVSWPIGNNTITSTNCLVRAEDAQDPLVVNDLSNSTFNVIAVFNITHPENGDVVIAEEPYNITWTKKGGGVNNVTLEYTTDGISWNWINPDGDHTVPNDGIQPWTPGAALPLSEICQMRITDLNNANATDSGYDVFYLRGNVTVTEPVAEESWQVGSPHNISWDKKGNISTVNIYYSADNGNSWSQITTGETASNETWEWNIPTGQTTSALNQARINVTDSSLEGFTYNMSPGFTVKGSLNLTAPSASGIVMNYTGTNTYNITWSRYGGIQEVQIRYSTDGNQSYPDLQTIDNVSGG